MITAMLADIDRAQHDKLRFLLMKHCPELRVVAAVNSLAEGRLALERFTPDIIFSDVLLSDGECFELCKRPETSAFELIVVTARREHAVQAIKYSALDYILKPVVARELMAAIAKAKLKRGANGHPAAAATGSEQHNAGYDVSALSTVRIALPTIDGYTIAEARKIVRCEAKQAYTNFYFTDGSHLIVSKTLREYERVLVQHGFMRVHNSHLINLNLVRRYVRGKGGQVIMADGSSITVSIRRKDNFLERLMAV